MNENVLAAIWHAPPRGDWEGEMTPYDRWLKVVATPGEHKFPWAWAQAIMALPYVEGEDWRHEKRVINRLCRRIPNPQVMNE